MKEKIKQLKKLQENFRSLDYLKAEIEFYKNAGLDGNSDFFKDLKQRKQFNKKVEKQIKDLEKELHNVVHYLGEFECVSGTLRVSDPCYEDLKTWCSGQLLKCKIGKWKAFVQYSNEDDWGLRVCKLMISSMYNFEIIPPLHRTNFQVGVDSGQAGFFDLKHFNDSSIAVLTEHPLTGENAWYDMCCEKTLGAEQAGIIPYGVVSSSGYGDGGYTCKYSKMNSEIIYAEIVFIGDEENEIE